MSAEAEIESFLAEHRRVSAPRFSEGTQLGDWRIVTFIARGGTAEVYRAERVSDGQVAALKVLHKNDEVHRQRLAREAEFLRTHRHTAFPVLLDSRIGEDGPSYLVEEFLYPLELPRKDGAIAQLMLKLCAAVGYLHCCGLVHRDLKPSNIMTRCEGGTDPVIVDFGLLRTGASSSVPPADSLTIEGGYRVGVGTPGYGAPEQFIGGEVSPSVDIHALGVIADRCFEGMPSAAWERIIRRATSSLPDRRYQTVASLARSIRRRHCFRWTVAAVLSLSLYCGLHILLWGWFSDPDRYMDTPSSSSAHGDLKLASSVLWVEKGANELKADGSKRYPYRRLERALAVATNGMTIVVRPGEYTGGVTLAKEGVRLVAEKGPEQTFLLGKGDLSVIRLSESSRRCEIRGFTIVAGRGTLMELERGKEWQGGGICVEGSGHLIADCEVTVNCSGTLGLSECSFGGGISILRSSAMVTNCLVRSNRAWTGCEGIFIADGSAVEIVDSTVAWNACQRDDSDYPGGIGLADASSVRIVNSVIKGNDGCQLGALARPRNRGTSAEVVNCEISDGLDPHGIENFTVTPRTSSAPIGYRAP